MKTKIEQFLNRHYILKRIYIHILFAVAFVPFLFWGIYKGFNEWRSCYWMMKHGG